MSFWNGCCYTGFFLAVSVHSSSALSSFQQTHRPYPPSFLAVFVLSGSDAPLLPLHMPKVACPLLGIRHPDLRALWYTKLHKEEVSWQAFWAAMHLTKAWTASSWVRFSLPCRDANLPCLLAFTAPLSGRSSGLFAFANRSRFCLSILPIPGSPPRPRTCFSVPFGEFAVPQALSFEFSYLSCRGNVTLPLVALLTRQSYVKFCLGGPYVGRYEALEGLLGWRNESSRV
jgi:hypothetical protein